MKTIVCFFICDNMQYTDICSVSRRNKLKCKVAVIMDAESGKILYEKSKDQRRMPVQQRF